MSSLKRARGRPIARSVPRRLGRRAHGVGLGGLRQLAYIEQESLRRLFRQAVLTFVGTERSESQFARCHRKLGATRYR